MSTHKSTAIKTIPVTSSQLSEVGYDADSKTLAIKFKSGGTYHYSNVEPAMHKALIEAPSVGSYFYREIKPFSGKYPYRKL